MNDELLTIEQAAKVLNVSTKTMRRWDMTGKLSPKRTVGNHRRYTRSEIEAYMKQRAGESVSVTNPVGVSVTPTPAGITTLLSSSAEETEPSEPVEDETDDGPEVIVEDENTPHLPTTRFSRRSIVMAMTGLVSMLFMLVVAIFTVPHSQMFAQAREQVMSVFPGGEGAVVTDTSGPALALRSKSGKLAVYNLNVNVPAVFGKKTTFLDDVEIKKSLTVKGKLTAPNIVYSLVAGQNVSITGDPQHPTISAGTTGGVSSFQGQTGAIALTAGAGLNVDGLQISNTGVLSVQDQTGNVQFSGGTGISLSGLTITNTDGGSAQDIFKNFTVDGANTIAADSNNDTINFAAGSGITLTGDSGSKTITITGSSSGLTGLTPNGVLYASSSTDVLTTSPPGAGQVLLGNTSGVPTFTALSGDLGVNGNGVVTILPDSIALGTDTTGNYQLGTVAGDGVTVTGTAGEGWSPVIGINLATSGTSSNINSNSGLETSSDGLSLLRGCANGQILKWNSVAGRWECSADSGGGGGSGGIANVNGNGYSSSDTTTLNFSNEFALTESPATQSNVAIDYTNSHITRDNQNQTISGLWNFTNLVGIGTVSPTAMLDVQGAYGSNAAAIINQKNSGNIFAASASGTTKFTIANNGDLIATGALSGLTGLSSSGTITFSGLGTGVVHSSSGVLSSSQVTNAELQNSSVTINTGTGLSGGGSLSLGGTLNLANAGVTSLTGTANQIAVSGATGAVTLSLPQDIATSSSPTFNGLTVSSLTRGADTITDFTGTGLQVVGNALETTLGTSVDLASEVNGILGTTNGGTGLNSYATGDLLYASGSNTLAARSIGSTGQILTVSGGVPTWMDAGGTINFWQRAGGAIAPFNITDDLLLGSTATSSAKFRISGTTGDASSAGNLTFNSAATVQTTNNQTLTFGGNTTGNIVFSPLNGSGTVTINGDLNLASGKVFQINGSNVLTTTTLGSSVVNSSLTSVGALNAGSISSGFGNIDVGTDSIGGGDFNSVGTTGYTSSGAGAGLTFSGTGNHDITASGGTLRLGPTTLNGAITGNNQNVTGLNNLSAAGTITFSSFSSNGGVLYTNGSGALAQATAGSATQVLHGGTTPSFSAVALGADVSGTLPIANGGTNTGSIGSAGSIAYSTGTAYGFSSAGNAGQVLLSGGTGVPTWVDAAVLGTNYLQRNLGVLSPLAITDDFAIGGTATSSAKFQVFGLNGNATTSGTLTFNTTGVVQTTNNQTLTFGGNSTGNIVFSPLNGSGTVTVNGNMNLASGDVYQINGTSVLSNNTLGSGVTTSSLTTVGALASGSIANGFGTIATANSISGSTLGIGGTTVVDNSRNAVNLANITASGTITFSGLSTGIAHVSSGGVISSSAVGLASADVTGTLGIGNGGTGLATTPTNGQLLIGNGSGYSLATISNGSGIGVSNGSGTISISNTGVLSLAGTANQISVSGATGAVTLSLPQDIATGSTPTFAALNLTNNTNQLVLGTSNTATITMATLTTGRTYTLPDATGTLCLSTGNCAGAGTSVTTAGGTTNRLAKFTASQAIGNASINDLYNSVALTIDASGNVGIGNVTPGAVLDVAGGNTGGNAAAIVNQTGASTNDIFAASSSGTTQFVIANNGDIQFTGGSGFLQTLTSTASASKTYNLPGFSGSTADICLSIGNCSGLGGSLSGSGSNGQLAFFTGSSSIASDNALFFDSTNKLFGIGNATPVAKLDVSGAVKGKALAIFNETGDQNILVGSASGTTRFAFDRSGNLNLTGGAYQIGGASVLSSTTLGAAVVNSSLTQVGALASGSIASGFGTIATANSISGSSLGISGTTVIDASRNIANAVNLTASGTITFSGLGQGIAHLSSGGVLSSSAIDLATGDITGTLGPTHGGTGLTSYTSGDLIYSNGTNSLTTLAKGADGQILSLVSGLPSWISSSTINFWQRASGAVAPLNITDDLLLGSTATSSAKFRISGTTGDASSAGNLTFNSAATVQTTNNQTLTVGGNSTGNIVFSPLNGSGTVTVNGIMNLASGNVYQINGTSVLSNNTLGSGVTTSSLTTVGALASGSIASGFGTIATNNSISGSTLGIGGTTVIDNSRNIGNAVNLTASGTITFSGLGQGIAHLSSGGVLSSSAVALGGSDVTGTLLYGNGGTGFNTYAQGDLLYGNVSGGLSKLALGGPLQYLTASGGNLVWTDANGSINFWQRANGVLAPLAITDDLAVGGTATSSAKFQVFGNTGNATTSGTLTFDAAGSIQTTKNQTLTIGGASTGNLVFSPLNGSGTVTVNGIMNLASGNVYQINGTSVLSNNTLGSGVTTSSLTTVGALASGSIAAGFGTIATNNSISGSSLGISGTTVIDASRNLTSIVGVATSLNPTAANTYDLGTGTGSQYRNIYGQTIYQGGNQVCDASGNCSGLTVTYWNQTNGAVYTKNSTVDLLLGSNATASARFAVTNINSGTPTASLSAGTNGGAYITADGFIQTTANQSLTIGGNTTGNITLSPQNGSGTVVSTGDLSLATGKSYQINGASVLSATALGSSVVGSSLTSVGALASGSIASGFGTIATANSISGSSLGISGTTVIDSSRNIANAVNLTASGTITFSGLGQGIAHLSSGGVLSSSAVALGGSDVTGTLGAGNGGTGHNTYSYGDLLFGNNSGGLDTLPLGGPNQYLTAVGGVLSWTDANGSINFWQKANGVLAPLDISNDLAVGGTATSSAKFQVFGLSGNATTSGTLTFNTTGTIQTTKNQTLTIGGASTGNLVFSPQNGAGTVTVNGIMNLASGNVYQINGTSVLSNNTLGSGVTTSSLTTVGALASGSIASGFGTIATNNSISGSTLGIGGTTVIDNSRNAVNLANITASGTITFSGLGQGIAHLSSGGVVSSSAIDLATGDITGTLGPTHGGTGLTSYTSGDLIYSNGTNSLTTLAKGADGQVLSLASGLPSWISTSSINFWQRASGAVAPLNITDDLLLGSTATGSAKFAFKNVAGGTPIASISANSGNNATYLTGDGTLATTNRGTLTIGNSAAYDTTGNVLINPNGTGNVGIGTSNPSQKLDVNGSINSVSYRVNGFLALSQSGNNLLINNNGQSNSALQLYAGNAQRAVIDTSGNLGINATSPLATLDVRGTSGITPIASFSGNTSFAAGVIDQSGLGDLFTASKSGASKFTVLNNGNIRINNYATAGGLLYTDGTGTVLQTGNGTGTQCLLGGSGGAPTWGSCASGTTNYWQENLGAVAPSNITDDLLLGGTATSSAKFAFKNVAGGTPTASISANTANNATFLTGDGNLGTTNAQTLTLGGATTGNIVAANTFLIQDGTNSNPGIGFASQPGLGIYRSAANIMDLVTPSGSVRVRVGTVNKIQFGTTGVSVAGSCYNYSSNGSDASGPFTSSLCYDASGSVGLRASTTAQTLGIYNTYTNSSNYESGTLGFSGNVFNIDTAAAGTGTVRNISIAATNATAVGVGTTSPLATLDVRGRSGITPVASVAGITSNAALMVDNSGVGDIFAASKSGATKFVVNNAGNVQIANLAASNNNSVLYTDNTGTIKNLTTGSNNLCLLSQSGGTPTWGACPGGSLAQYWQESAGAVAPANITDDLLLGSTATGSAKFAFTGVAGGTPTASISAGVAGGVYLNATGTLATTANQTLTLGAAGTGNLAFAPGGNTAFTAFANGRIGVGTSNPLATLDVRGNSGTIPSASVSANSAFAALVVDQSGPGSIFTASSSGQNRFVVLSNGNVGIGKAIPAFPLDVVGSINSTGSLSVTGGVTVGGTSALAKSGAYLQINNTATANQGITFFTTNQVERARFDGTTGYFGVGNTSPLTTLHVDGANSAGRAAFIVDQTSSATDILAASASGTTKFKIDTSGNLGLAAGAGIDALTAGNLSIGNGSTTNTLTLGRSGQGITLPGFNNCGMLTTSGTALTCSAAPGAATQYWQENLGAVAPANITDDLLLGSTATSSAKFAFKNVAAGTPTASISANTTNNATFLTGDGNLGTTNAQTLTLGGNSTGNIVLSPTGGSGTVSSTGNLSLATGKTFQISGSGDVLSASTLGTTVVTSSLTTVGVLNAGSISSGFGAIDIGGDNLTAGGTITFGGLGTGVVKSSSGVLSASAIGLATADVTGTLGVANGGTGTATAFTQGSLVFAGAAGVYSQNNSNFFWDNTNLRLGIGTASPLASLDVRGTSGTTPVASVAGTTAQAALVVDNSGVGDIFTASKSGATKFTINNAGNVVAVGSLTASNFSGSSTGTNTGDITVTGQNYLSLTGQQITANAINLSGTNVTSTLGVGNGGTGITSLAAGSLVYGAGTTSPYNTLAIGGNNTVLTSNGSAPQWSTSLTLSGITPSGTTGTFGWFQRSGGAIAPTNITDDLLLGSTATSSAKFAFTGVAGGTPTASISGSTANVATYLTGDGTLGTTKATTLTLGAAGTGNVVLAPGGVTALTAAGANLTGAGTVTSTGLLSANAGITVTGGTANINASGTGATSIGNGTGTVSLTLGSDARGDIYYRNVSGNLQRLAIGASNTFLTGGTDPSWTAGYVNDATNTTLTRTGSGPYTLGLNLGNTNTWTATQTYNAGATVANNSTLTINSGSNILLSGLSANAALYTDGSKNVTTTAPTSGAIGYFTRTGTNLSPTTSTDTLSLGTTSPLATFDVRGNSGTTPAASVSATTAQAALVVDNSGVGDLFTASSSGATRFTIEQNGNILVNTNADTADSHKLVIKGTDHQLGLVNSSNNVWGLANWSGTNGLYYQYNSTNKMFLSSNGSLELAAGLSGAAYSPLATLDARANSATTPVASISGSTNMAVAVVDQSGNGDIFTASKSGATKFTINNAGNVVAVGTITASNFSGTSSGTNTGNVSLSGENYLSLAGQTITANAINLSGTNVTSTLGVANGGTGTGTAFTQGSLVFAGASGVYSQNNANFFWDNTALRLGIGVNSNLLAALDVRGTNATAPAASFSASTTNAAVIVDNTGAGDLFTASKSGATKFVINNAGNVQINNLTTGIAHVSSTGILSSSAIGLATADVTGTLGVANGGTGTGTTFTQGSIVFAGGSGVYSQNNANFFWDNTNNRLGIGANANLAAALDVRGTNATAPAASFSASTTNAAVIVDNRGTGDILTASSSGLTRFTVQQSGKVVIGTTTNGITFDPTSAVTAIYNGTSRPTRQIVLSPEYAGAVLTASGAASSVTNGVMTSDASPSASYRNYYQWVSSQTDALKEYTVALRVTLPKDFGAWTTSNAFLMDIYTNLANTTDNKVDIIAYKAGDGSVVFVKQNQKSSSDKTWTSISLNASGMQTLSPGDTIVFYIKMSSWKNFDAMIGDITLSYLANF